MEVGVGGRRQSLDRGDQRGVPTRLHRQRCRASYHQRRQMTRFLLCILRLYYHLGFIFHALFILLLLLLFGPKFQKQFIIRALGRTTQNSRQIPHVSPHIGTLGGFLPRGGGQIAHSGHHGTQLTEHGHLWIDALGGRRESISWAWGSRMASASGVAASTTVSSSVVSIVSVSSSSSTTSMAVVVVVAVVVVTIVTTIVSIAVVAVRSWMEGRCRWVQSRRRSTAAAAVT
mmetsp:Transcript_6191/g.7059  ORF Transcript_6191/g.7059 Transcript_6191/m.7059 type:complete len:230 (+) Transcript_6191:627-1316(+)